MIIFEDDEYVAHHRQGSSRFILVTFSGIRAQEAIDGTYFAKEPCEKLDITAVGLVAKTNSWYRAPGIHDALREMQRRTAPYEDVYTYGISSGAYAAIKYSGVLRATYVLALAPQWSLDRRERPGDVTQFDAYYRDYMASMGVRKGETSGKTYVVIDRSDREDVIHADFMVSNVAEMTVIPVFHTGHVVSNHIKGTANLQGMLASIKSPAALSRAISDARRGSQANQKNIVAAAIHRHPTLAYRALRCRRSLRSGACASFMADLPLVRALAVGLSSGSRPSLARSLLSLALYRIDAEPVVDHGLHLCLTYDGEMLAYSPADNSLSATRNLQPKDGFHLALFDTASGGEISVGYRTMDGLVEIVNDRVWAGLRSRRALRHCHLLSYGKYLSTQPNGDIHTDRTEPNLWEQFHLLPVLPLGRVRSGLARLATMRITAVGNGQNAIHNNGGHTFIENWTGEDDFDHVRLIYMVDAPDADLAIGGASVGAASRLTNNPVDGRGEPVALRPVTFDGNGQALGLEEQLRDARLEPRASATTSLELPAFPQLARGSFAAVPQLYFSDWVPLASVQRADGGIGRLIHVRTLIAGGRAMRGVTTSVDGRDNPADPYASTGRSYQTCFVRGNFVAGGDVPELDAVPPPAQGRALLYGIQLMCRRPVATVQMVGDSIGTGYGSRTNHIGFAQLAVSLVSTPALPACFLQSGTYAQPSAAFYRAAAQDLDASRVAVAIIQTWSGNDVDAAMSERQAQVVADTAWRGALRYGDLVRRQGGVPIYLSAVPQKTKCLTAAQDLARLSSVARCAELGRQGEWTLDLNGILGDRGSPVGYAAALSDDQLHPNHDGHARVASRLAPMLTIILDEGRTSAG